MNIRYLGTAAYEGVPSLFCECRVCRRSKEEGGRNLRSRSQALVDGQLLLDFNPDTVWHSQKYGLDWSNIRNCLITHSHSDHLYPEDVEIAAENYSNLHNTLHFYAAKDGYEKLKAIVGKPNMGGGATAELIEAGKEFTLSGGEYTVLPLRANHEPSTSPVIYAIRRGEKRMLYAHDTGVFFEDAWQGLRKFGKFDFVSLDCTGCLGIGGEWRNGHMSLKTNLEVLERMRGEGIADESTIVVLNHFSHNGGQTYGEMCAEAEKFGLIVAYDGLEIEF